MLSNAELSEWALTPCVNTIFDIGMMMGVYG